ncbi:hypothetical protein GCM10011506_47890 [Marivirga lumbricoides]|uniref:RHS repeat-associated core domain-containing protein n=1 Tax=Marivirga lumbricoides TaxID=1046115 RepID=A0ABQ1N7N0_9BACT|nr:hypothetical protein GCM10011506_47890 [Marivirga lumbricoides]
MGCLKLYDQEAGEGIGKTAFFSGESLKKKEGTLKNRYNYYPFGLTFNSYQRSYSKENNFKYNGIERDPILDMDMAFFRSYDPALGRWWQIDPIIKHHESPYAWVTNNPLSFNDFLGADSTQRANAVAKAEEYVAKNPGGSYELGAKGSPGQNVDCSGLVTGCVVAGGEPDPNSGNSNGVTNIAENTTAVEESDVEPGNIVILNDKKHTGLITEVVRDKDGNITTLKMIDSGGSEGPRNTTLIDGGKNKYYGNRIVGYRKFDTKPDAQTGSSSQNSQAGASIYTSRPITVPRSTNTVTNSESMFDGLVRKFNSFINELDRQISN